MKHLLASIICLSYLLCVTVTLQVINTPINIQIRSGDNLQITLNSKEIFDGNTIITSVKVKGGDPLPSWLTYTQLPKLASLNMGDIVQSFVIDGERAVVSYSIGKYAVMNITEPSNVVSLAQFQSTNIDSSVANYNRNLVCGMNGNIVYVVSNPFYEAWDISDLSNIRMINSVKSVKPSNPTSLLTCEYLPIAKKMVTQFTGNFVFITPVNSDGSLSSSLASPNLFASLRQMSVYKEEMIYADGTSMIEIIKTDGTYTRTAFSVALCNTLVANDHLYLKGRNGDIHVFSISSSGDILAIPNVPTTTANTGSSSNNVFQRVGDLMMVADEVSSLRYTNYLLNIDNINPVVMLQWRFPSYLKINKVRGHKNAMYIARGQLFEVYKYREVTVVGTVPADLKESVMLEITATNGTETITTSLSLTVSFKCYGIESEDTKVCGGKGKCIAKDFCHCFNGYAGFICQRRCDYCYVNYTIPASN